MLDMATATRPSTTDATVAIAGSFMLNKTQESLRPQTLAPRTAFLVRMDTIGVCSMKRIVANTQPTMTSCIASREAGMAIKQLSPRSRLGQVDE
jgi:hypothetical protein